MSSSAPLSDPQNNPVFPALCLHPLNDSFIPKHISLNPSGQRVKIGRQTNAKTSPGERNGYFDSTIMSRQHAEVWEENGKIFIQDVRSSNGTFVNGERLSPEGLDEDIVEFGIDLVGEDKLSIIYHKVAARVSCIFNEQQARAEQQQIQGPL
ncbi:FHA domain-containing protein [Mycena sanguinolenta]|uniref:FHA domain-containing protein n=1 Tax=Mycena sanguinolenta TaxID=230812 RepID=A0A8H6YJY2_9AGAR|nr:FHA domain-containing protein [Mycena sanguinolenta]